MLPPSRVQGVSQPGPDRLFRYLQLQSADNGNENHNQKESQKNPPDLDRARISAAAHAYSRALLSNQK
jgi:hypothetical protein